jgi:spermidine/putrescine transport system ATP-binding protein
MSNGGNEHFLTFDGVTKRFGSFTAVDRVSLSVRQGEVFSLLGPSGCGKTTLLRMCAGFERPDTGRIILDGRDITDLPPNRRQVNLVFQNYALFPHLTVRENIGFGLKVAKRGRREIDNEVDRMLDLIQMEGHGDKKPSQISGGQKQRVALARALINRPQVLLLDEPLAALDLKLRQRMLIELDNIHDEVGITFLYVTHDQEEAMSLSDRIAVMNRGLVEQVGTPAEIYEAPVSSFVAAFIGDTNFFEGRVTEVDGAYSLLEIDGFPAVRCFNDTPRVPADLVYLSVRPEKIRISRPGTEPPGGSHNVVEGTVEDLVYLGSSTKYWVRVQDYRLVVLRQHHRFLLDEAAPPTWQDRVCLSWHPDDGYMLRRYQESDENLLSVPDHPLGGQSESTA